jgi:nucleoside-diphosphate-sugar epimerase
MEGNSERKIFITGATGFIGGRLAKHFADKKIAVRAMKRKKSKIPDFLRHYECIEWAEGSLFDTDFLENAVTGCTEVIHAAAMVTMAKKYEAEMYRTNVIGTANLVNVSIGKPLKKFLHISSIAAVGNPSKEGKIVNENHKFEFSSSFYGQTKYEAELEVWRGHAEGLPVLVVNPSFVLGYGDFTRSSLRLFQFVADGKAFFYPKGNLNCVDVRDLLSVCEILLESDKIGERYIVNAASLPYKQILSEIAVSLSKKPPKFPLSIRFGLFSAYFSEIIAAVFGKEPLLTRDVVLSSSNQFFYDHAKVKKELGVEFRDVFETIREVCAEMKKRID